MIPAPNPSFFPASFAWLPDGKWVVIKVKLGLLSMGERGNAQSDLPADEIVT